MSDSTPGLLPADAPPPRSRARWVIAIAGTLLLAAIVVVAIVAFSAFAPGGSPVPIGPTHSATPSASATPEPAPTATEASVYDPAAFLAEVRPALVEIGREVDRNADQALLASIAPDEMIVMLGEASLGGDEQVRTSVVLSLIEQSNGVLDEDRAGRAYDIVHEAAARHLVR